MQYDYKTLYEKHAAFYKKSPVRLKILKLVNTACSWLFAVAYVGLLASAALSDKIPLQKVLPLFFAPALALFAVSAIRLGAGRPRPYSSKGAHVTPLVSRGDRDGDSFPSRHLACAAVIATVFCSVLPVTGALLILCCFVLAYTRFAIGVHYPSDLAAGIALGVLCGLTAFFL